MGGSLRSKYAVLVGPQQATVPSVFTPQALEPPALTDTKPSAGRVAQVVPQQTTVPSVVTPQEHEFPALIDAKVPEGAIVSPVLGSPQQTMVASARMPQA
jgi:hypothetical protein